jgi:hypothetical protein
VARQLWEQIGRPPFPVLVAGGRIHLIGHPNQLAGMLGVDAGPSEPDEATLAWDIVTLTELWCGVVDATPWDLVDAPTPSRERTTRELALNVFWFLELARMARTTGRYAPLEDLETDARRNRTITTADLLRAFVGEQARAWQAFALDWYPPDGETVEGPSVETRGDGRISFAELLGSQRWHAAMHLRQTTVHLARQGVDHDVDGVLAAMRDLDLPANPY